MENIVAAPGICNAALQLISSKLNIYQDVCLMIDSMHIKRLVSLEPSTNEMFGFVDTGNGPGIEEAAEVLVFMVVSLKLHGRLPVAYYLINGICSEDLTELVKDTITSLDCRGCRVRVITMDGAACNIGMVRLLGCNLESGNITTSFRVEGEYAHT